MTLLHFDGFEAISHNLAAKYNIVSNTQVTATTPRTGSRCITRAGSATTYALTKIVAPADEHATFIAGMAAMYTTSNAPRLSFMSDGGTIHHIAIYLNPTFHRIDVYRGNGTTLLGSSADSILSASAYHHIEAKVVLGDSTAGSVEVRLNGSPTPVVNLPGIDTKNAGTKTVFDAIMYHSQGSSVFLDDVHLCNGAGSAPYNSFLGDVRVETLVPTGAGTTTGMTPSTGANWAAVDEIPPSATDYNYSDVLDTFDTYQMSDLAVASGATVFAAQVHMLAAKSDAGLRSIADVLRSGGTNYTGADQVLTTSFTDFYGLYLNNPATGLPWTVAEINALEVGTKVR